MTSARISAVLLATMASLGVALLVLAPASAAAPSCLLVTGQLLSCVEDIECSGFNAVCNQSSGFCACASASDASAVADAAVRDAATRSDDADSIGSGAIPGTGGATRPLVGGCSYVGR